MIIPAWILLHFWVPRSWILNEILSRLYLDLNKIRKSWWPKMCGDLGEILSLSQKDFGEVRRLSGQNMSRSWHYLSMIFSKILVRSRHDHSNIHCTEFVTVVELHFFLIVFSFAVLQR